MTDASTSQNCTATHDWREWRSVEHYYQAQKFASTSGMLLRSCTSKHAACCCRHVSAVRETDMALQGELLQEKLRLAVPSLMCQTQLKVPGPVCQISSTSQCTSDKYQQANISSL